MTAVLLLVFPKSAIDGVNRLIQGDDRVYELTARFIPLPRKDTCAALQSSDKRRFWADSRDLFQGLPVIGRCRSALLTMPDFVAWQTAFYHHPNSTRAK
jgi:hypothetical protein